MEKIIQGTAEQLATEVRRSLEFFDAANPSGEMRKIYLTGGCAKIRMLPSLIEERIGTPVEVFNPFTKIEYHMDEYSPEYIKEVGPMAAVAVGLALRREDLQ